MARPLRSKVVASGCHNAPPAASGGMRRRGLQSTGRARLARRLVRSATRVEPVDLAWLADAAQRVTAERAKAGTVAQRGGEFGGDQEIAAEHLAQQLDPRDLVDGRADDGEIEAIDRADIAVEHLAEVQREIDRRGRLAEPAACP